MDSCPSWYFDEEFGERGISNPNLKRERTLRPAVQKRKRAALLLRFRTIYHAEAPVFWRFSGNLSP